MQPNNNSLFIKEDMLTIQASADIYSVFAFTIFCIQLIPTELFFVGLTGIHWYAHNDCNKLQLMYIFR